MNARWRHLGPLALFAAFTIAWTWPLARHLADAIPGDPGDNYSFLWNFWWMRHTRVTPGLAFFRTTFLMAPLGTNIVGQSHTALPAWLGATLLRQTSVITAANLELLAFVFLNMAMAYALAWAITAHRRAAVLAGVLFGTSPYLQVHLLGHFELMAVWILPAAAWCLRRALQSGSLVWAAATGVVLVIAAYTTYYYLVFTLLLVVTYMIAWLNPFAVGVERRHGVTALIAERVALGISAACVALASAIAITGGWAIAVGTSTVTARTPQNALTGAWLFALAWAASRWRLTVGRLETQGRVQRGAGIAIVALAVLIAGAIPLGRDAARIVASGEYVTPQYFWRSAPRGVDALALLLGPPRHPLAGGVSRRFYAALHQDPVEAIGWMGILPVLLLIGRRRRDDDARIWRAVAIVFVLWSLGPFLTVAGVNTGLILPEMLARFVPFVANARMPGRAMSGAFLAVSMLAAMRVSRATGRCRSPVGQWALVALIAFEFFDAPIPVTPLDRPSVYEQLAGLATGVVCEAPFGVGDGLSGGAGSQDRRVLYYATIHEHPLAGGYVSRMPAGVIERYRQTPIVGTLLRLSDDRNAVATDDSVDLAGAPCRYYVVREQAASAGLLAFVARLPLERISESDGLALYRAR